MLLTFWYVILTLYGDWQEHRDRMRILRLIRDHIHKQSLRIHRKKSLRSSVSTDYTTDAPSSSVSTDYNADVPSSSKDVTNGACHLLEEIGTCVIYSLEHQIPTNLKDWTCYFDQENKADCKLSGSENTCCIKLSTKHPKDETEFLERLLSMPQEKMVRFSDHTVPFAWRAGDRFEILADCSQEKLALLIDAFNKERLVTDEMLEILSIETILPVGHARKLVRPDSMYTSTPVLGSPVLPKSKAALNMSLDLTKSTGVECDHSETVFVDPTDRTPVTIVPKSLSSGSISSPGEQDSNKQENIGATSHEDVSDNTGTNSQNKTNMKPPNVLIYCGKKDSNRLYQTAKKTVELCLNSDKYLLYHLKHDQVDSTPWADNSRLVVICSDKVYDGVDRRFYDYFLSGGTVISFASAFDNQFVSKEQVSSAAGITRLTYSRWEEVPVICGRHVYSLPGGLLSMLTGVKVTVLGTDIHDKPVIVKVQHEESGGIALLLQVNLDKDPMEMAVSPQAFQTLKEANEKRFMILKDLMTTLGLDCNSNKPPQLSPGYMLAQTQSNKEAVLTSLKSRIGGGIIRSRTTSLHLVSSLQEFNGTINADTLPVITSPPPKKHEHFDMKVYSAHLHTKVLGQVVLYVDVVPTTMTLLEGLMFSCPDDVGLVAVAGRQTRGRGRSENSWISPAGCAMCTVLVKVPLQSELGQAVSFIQHIMSLAVVEAVRTIPGYQDLDLQLKWPNDIYYSNKMKLGGVIVNSTVMNNIMYASIGCGFNVTNSNPTICINDVIEQHNRYHGTRLPHLNTSQLLGRCISVLEELIDTFQERGREAFLEQYYNRWMHGGATVTLESENKEVDIIGLDVHGYLLVKTPEGTEISLQPDGNSFDIMHNLIRLKT